MTTAIYASRRRPDCRNRILRPVEPSDYAAWSQALVEAVAADPRVVGVVALGSMAGRDYGPDRWSDHDFFVVTEPGRQEELRRDLGWLPRSDRAVLAFRETEHGSKVVHDDGHLLEFAVFDLEELGLARVNRYRVLLDRGGVTRRMQEVAAATAAAGPGPGAVEHAFGMLVTSILVGSGRHARGESLSGAFFVKGLAVRWLALLVTQLVAAEESSLLDDLDPLRRFDRVHPAIAVEIERLLRAPTLAAAAGLLDLAERELRRRAPGLGWTALEVVRGVVGDLESVAG
jgi:hypothetical protein